MGIVLFLAWKSSGITGNGPLYSWTAIFFLCFSFFLLVLSTTFVNFLFFLDVLFDKGRATLGSLGFLRPFAFEIAGLYQLSV